MRDLSARAQRLPWPVGTRSKEARSILTFCTTTTPTPAGTGATLRRCFAEFVTRVERDSPGHRALR